MQKKFTKIHGQIQKECETNNRPKNEVQLIAASKAVDANRIIEAYELGQRIFAENYVQDFEKKYKTLKKFDQIKWHFIGHLQTNKVAKIVGKCELIQSVDSLKILKKINSKAKSLQIKQDVLLQVKFANESTKTGLRLEDLRDILQQSFSLESVNLKGLMVILPLGLDENQIEQNFLKLKTLKNEIKKDFSLSSFNELSMGMTEDFLLAIRSGSTMIRLGRALFGERKYEK